MSNRPMETKLLLSHMGAAVETFGNVQGVIARDCGAPIVLQDLNDAFHDSGGMGRSVSVNKCRNASIALLIFFCGVFKTG